jgi:hypothetical protein
MAALVARHLLEHRTIGGVGESRPDALVLRLGLVLLLLQAQVDDARVAEALEPGERRRHRGRIGCVTRGRLDAFGPPARVAVFGGRQAPQDGPLARIRLAFDQQAVRAGGLHFAAPHLLDRVELLVGHIAGG